MQRKKRSKQLFSIKLSWIGFLSLGIILGIASQRIPEMQPQIKNDQSNQHSYRDNHLTSLPGQPISSFIIHRTGYSLAYDARNRNPAWVYEHLTSENIQGSTNRSHFDFKEDESIPKHLRATLVDYRQTGFDRGHMAPAADHKANAQAMHDTFYLTNMCAQCPRLNRGYWSKLEKHVRNLTKEYKNVYVITGPLYLPQQESDGKRYVKYQLIGPNDVAVPTHFFKIITLENSQGKIERKGYILPNSEISSNTPLESFQTTIQKIEKIAGFILTNN